jgi:hypothetical protein
MARKNFDKTLINRVVEEFTKKTEHLPNSGFFKMFIERFPRKKAFDKEEWENGLSGRAWYPEGELWMLGELFDVDFENADESKDLTTEHWVDFFNELNDNNW